MLQKSQDFKVCLIVALTVGAVAWPGAPVLGQVGSGPVFSLGDIAVEASGDLVVAGTGFAFGPGISASVVRVDPGTGDRTIVSDAGTGTGPALVTPSGIAVEATSDLVVADQDLNAVVRVDPVTGNRTIVSDAGTGTGPTFAGLVAIAVESSGDLVVMDFASRVLRVDPVTGNRTIVSDAGTGTGPGLGNPKGIAVEAAGSLVVTSTQLAGVVRVDPVTGDRSIVSDAGTGTGLAFSDVRGIAVEAGGALIVVDSDTPSGAPRVVRVDPVTGNRTIVSDVGTGAGPAILLPRSVAVEASGDLVVTDLDLEAVVRVDPVTGDRTIVSDVGTGAGRAFQFPTGLAVGATGDLVVGDGDAVVRVDPVTGNRTILSDGTTGTGPVLGSADGIAVEATGDLVVADSFPAAVVRVDPITGNRTIVSDAGTGTGPTLVFPRGIAVEASGDLVVIDLDLNAVVRVDPVTGNRTILSDGGTGTGPAFQLPVGVAVEASGDLVVTDTSLAAVVRVDPITGDRTVVSDDTTGTGPAFFSADAIAVEAAGTLIVSDVSATSALVRVDPVTGDRTVVSDDITGTGPALVNPRGIAVEGAGDLVVTDLTLFAVLRVHPVTGDRSCASAGGALCHTDTGAGAGDADGDQVPDTSDNCTTIANPDQRNSDCPAPPTPPGLGCTDGGDLCDPCPDDPTNACVPDKSAAGTIGPAGGTLCTPDNSTCLAVPPGTFSAPTSVSITGGIDPATSTYCLSRDCQNEPPVSLVTLRPEGVTFDPPIAVTLAWDDVNDDGFVDDGGPNERALSIFRNGVPLFENPAFNFANRGRSCRDHDTVPTECTLPDPGNGVLDSCCDKGLPEPANQWTFELSQFSEYAVAAECGETDARRTRLVVSRLDTPPGDDRLTFKGELTLGASTLAALDPATAGLVVQLIEPGGAVLDALVPPGPFNPAIRVGWKVQDRGSRGRSWKYKDRTANPPGGIVSVLVKDKGDRDPGVVKFVLKGKNGAYPVTTAVEAALVFRPTNACVSARFPGPPEPACELRGNGSRLLCKRSK